MTVAEESIDVDVPVRAAYEQWVRFEEFPRFMAGVREVRRLGDGRLKWAADICGHRAEWLAEIKEDVPEKRIAWESQGGAFNAGTVSFAALSATRTRVTLRLESDARDIAKIVEDQLGSDPEDVKGDLECFKEIAEDRESEVAERRSAASNR